MKLGLRGEALKNFRLGLSFIHYALPG